MLIGPDRAGDFLEVGVLDVEGDDPVVIHAMRLRWNFRHSYEPDQGVITMRHTDEQIEEAARRFETWADKLDPGTAKVDRTDDLRVVADATDALRRAEA